MPKKPLHKKKWHVVNDWLVSDWEDNAIICTCWDIDSKIWGKQAPNLDDLMEIAANVRCLAKAPEMLGMLKDILSKLERGKRVSKAALRSIINDVEYGERNG